jgi:Ca2+-binding RTX toxin-like protein
VGSGPLAGVHLQNATFRKGTVTGPLPTSFDMAGVTSSGADVIEDSTITAETAIFMGGGGRASRIDATASKGFDIVSNTGTGFYTVEDVLWRPPAGQSGSGIVAACGAQSVNVTVRNVTFALTPGLGTASLVACPSGTGRLDIDSSIFDGGNNAIVIGNGSNVSAGVSYSNFDAAKIQSTDPSDVQQGAGNLNEVPDFVGGGDFRLKSTSNLLDKGDPAALAVGESATDVGGQPRVVDAFPLLCSPSPPRRDMGAHEFQPPTPPPGTCGGATTPPPSPQPGPAPGPTPPILGTPGADVLYGTPGNDVINGLGGNDVIFGLAGNDVIYGLDGNDVIFGNEGRDRIFGGLGSDYLHGGQQSDRCRGGPGSNILRSC